MDLVWKNSPSGFCFDCHTGTGSDVKVPKKPQRPMPSHTVKHSSHIHKHSLANQNETTNIPALRDGSTSPSRKNSPGKPADGHCTKQNGLVIEPNISANSHHTGQNNRDWNRAKPAVKNSSGAHQPRDKDAALRSPQKHREKRKHCDSVDSDKRKRTKRKHSKDSRCEGHRISHLVKKGSFQNAESEEYETEKTSDDYVLAKLFKKSGRLFVHTLHQSCQTWFICKL